MGPHRTSTSPKSGAKSGCHTHAVHRRGRLAVAAGGGTVPGIGADRATVGSSVPAAGPGGNGRPAVPAGQLAAAHPAAGGAADHQAALAAAVGTGADRASSRVAPLDGAQGAGPLPDGPAGLAGPGHRTGSRRGAPLRTRPPGDWSTSTSRSSAGSPTAADTCWAARPARKNTRPRQASATLPAQRRRRPLPAGLHRDPHRRDAGDRRRVLAPGQGVLRRPRHHRRAGPDRQRLLLPLPAVRDALARRVRTNGPGPTGPRPTARSNASTAPCSTSGPTPAPTAPTPTASPPSPAGCITYNHHRGHTALGGKPPISRLAVIDLCGQNS